MYTGVLFCLLLVQAMLIDQIFETLKGINVCLAAYRSLMWHTYFTDFFATVIITLRLCNLLIVAAKSFLIGLSMHDSPFAANNCQSVSVRVHCLAHSPDAVNGSGKRVMRRQ
jgi:hypothetical protein